MPGPYSSDHDPGADGPQFPDSHASEPVPTSPAYPPPGQSVEAPPPAAHPGPLPPPLPYPRPRRRRLLVGAVAVLALIAALTAAILRGSHSGHASEGAFSDATATAAIQNYLDALEQGDTETIARNSLCGIYEAVRDPRPDQALAKLSSGAFRKQFSEAQVTSIDKIVYWSDYQAQVLFSMRVQAATGSETRAQIQGIAHLLSQHNQILVCSYVQRTSGTY